MAKAIKKPVEIEFITFEDFVEYGKQNSTNIAENGMPWSFDYKGHPISHENDEAYVIPTLEGTLLFTPKEVLITGVKGEIYPCRIDIFEATYDFGNEGYSKGAALITEERKEQVVKHGWNIENDSYYENEELLQAAVYCISQEIEEWPTGWDTFFQDKILAKDRIGQLKVAGAFIAAEIDRLQAIK